MSRHTLIRKIALTGCKGHGKSLLASLITSNNKEFREMTFSSPIKDIVSSLFGLDDFCLNDPYTKEEIVSELGVSPRQLLQVIGTELFRESLNKNLPSLKLRGGSIWIHLLSKKLDELEEIGIVVSDCRFPDEYNELKKRGFTVLKINRPERVMDVKVNNTDCLNTLKHSSESGCPFDFEILNDGTPDDLYSKFLDAMNF